MWMIMYDNVHTETIIIEIKLFDAIKRFALYSGDRWLFSLNANNGARKKTISNINFGHKGDVLK